MRQLSHALIVSLSRALWKNRLRALRDAVRALWIETGFWMISYPFLDLDTLGIRHAAVLLIGRSNCISEGLCTQGTFRMGVY